MNLATLNYNNDKIIASIKSGKDLEVLQELYVALYPKIRGYIQKNGGDSDEAKDVFQEGVIILYRHIKLGKFKEEYKIDGFLFKVCRNLWINRAKQMQATTEFDVFAANESGEDFLFVNVVAEERYKIIQGIFHSLGERCRDLLNATIYENLSMKEIAKELGFATTDAAKTKHYKCKQRLISKIKDHAAFKELLQHGL